MPKKNKSEVETELRSAQPEEVQEWSQQLAGLVQEHGSIKARAKAAARDFKTQLEANEEEQERLSRMIITQQEEVPVKRQMTLAEIEDQRRHELSIEEFQRDSGQTLLRKDEPSAPSPEVARTPESEPTAEKSDASAAQPVTVDDLILQFEKQFSIPTSELRHGSTDYGLVMKATERKLVKEHENVSGDGYEIRLTHEGRAQLKKLLEARKKKRKAKERSNGNGSTLANKSDVVKADPLDLVPDDKHNRTWADLSESELMSWKNTIMNKGSIAKLLSPGAEKEHEAYIERIDAEIKRRDDEFFKADAKGAANEAL